MAETASLLTYQAAWLRDTGRHYKRQAAMAKLYATESAVTATRMATQVFGGYGFIDETLVARQYDAPDPGDRRGHQRDPAPGHRP